ncbi:hypothetical protein C8Q74DRAFT_1251187, partial [Fomes fomentarius]
MSLQQAVLALSYQRQRDARPHCPRLRACRRTGVCVSILRLSVPYQACRHASVRYRYVGQEHVTRISLRM